MPVLELREKLDQAHELLRQAQGMPEGERLWLLTLAWSQLHEAAGALETTGAMPPVRATPRRRSRHRGSPATTRGAGAPSIVLNACTPSSAGGGTSPPRPPGPG